jgi:hypothetical protein
MSFDPLTLLTFPPVYNHKDYNHEGDSLFRNVSISGTATIQDLTVSDNLTVNNNLAINGNVAVTGNLAVTGSITPSTNASAVFHGVTTVNQSIANNAAVANVTGFDVTGGTGKGATGFVGSTGTFTVPVTGTYWMKTELIWAGNATGTRSTSITSTSAGKIDSPPGAGTFYQSVGDISHIIAGTVVNINVQQTSGGALNIQPGSSFSCFYVGP